MLSGDGAADLSMQTDIVGGHVDLGPVVWGRLGFSLVGDRSFVSPGERKWHTPIAGVLILEFFPGTFCVLAGLAGSGL
jgi:hypothetical protein